MMKSDFKNFKKLRNGFKNFDLFFSHKNLALSINRIKFEFLEVVSHKDVYSTNPEAVAWSSPVNFLSVSLQRKTCTTVSF